MLAHPRAPLGSVALVLLFACGDAGTATSSAGGTSTDDAPSTTRDEPTTSTVPTGGITDAATATSSAVTGAATSIDATTTTSTTTSTSSDVTTSTGDDSTTGAPVEPDGCVASVDGWCWSYPRINGNRLRDAWYDGQGRTWIVGEGSTILYSDDDGSGWHSVPAAHIEGLRGVWGAAPDDVWVVGDYGLISHWDGAAWSKVASPTVKWLRAVWGAAADDVWAVGDGNTMLHYDGQVWSAFATGLNIQDFTSVWGSGPDDVWAGATGFGGIVIHWDGMKWSHAPIDDLGNVTGLWGRGPDDVYATRDQNTTLHHWTGGPAWDDLEVPPNRPLNAVIGGDGAELWAAGRDGLIHHDGNTWTPDPALPQTVVYGLERAGDDLLAIGSRGVIGRRRDGAWAVESGNTTTPLVFTFSAIGGTGPDDIWVAGRNVAHWDGEAWTYVDVDQGVAQFNDIAVAGDTLWAVSSDENEWLWNIVDGAWTKVASVPYEAFNAVWAADESHVWIAGEFISEDLAYWDGQALTLVDAPGGGILNTLYDIHGTAADDVWAVGGGERLVHFDGANWALIHAKMGGDTLLAVWVAGPDDVWVAGERLHHWDGVGLTEHVVDNPWAFTDLWGSGPDDVWLSGGLSAGPGVLFHWDGAAWTRQVTGSGMPIDKLWGDGSGAVWAAGELNSVLVRRP